MPLVQSVYFSLFTSSPSPLGAELCECRRAVQHRVSAAAANQASGGTMLHEYPDFILPFIIQYLAHHPDFPTQEVRRSIIWSCCVLPALLVCQLTGYARRIKPVQLACCSR